MIPNELAGDNINKVNTTMVVGPHDDHTFIASLHGQQMYPKMCSIDIFVNIQTVGWNLK